MLVISRIRDATQIDGSVFVYSVCGRFRLVIFKQRCVLVFRDKDEFLSVVDLPARDVTYALQKLYVRVRPRDLASVIRQHVGMHVE